MSRASRRKGAHRPAHMPEVQHPQIDQLDVGARSQLFSDRRLYDDAAKLCVGLQARRKVHAIAEDIIWFHDDVCEVDADAQQDRCVLRAACRAGQAVLN